jgi:hypothetical protein
MLPDQKYRARSLVDLQPRQKLACRMIARMSSLNHLLRRIR